MDVLGMCVDIAEIWFVIANGQISSIRTSAHTTSFFSFSGDNEYIPVDVYQTICALIL